MMVLRLFLEVLVTFLIDIEVGHDVPLEIKLNERVVSTGDEDEYVEELGSG